MSKQQDNAAELNCLHNKPACHLLIAACPYSMPSELAGRTEDEDAATCGSFHTSTGKVVSNCSLRV